MDSAGVPRDPADAKQPPVDAPPAPKAPPVNKKANGLGGVHHSKSLPSLAATAPGSTPSAPPEGRVDIAPLHSSTVQTLPQALGAVPAPKAKPRKSRKQQLGAMSRLADAKHRAIKVNDLGDEIEGLLHESTDLDAPGLTPEPSVKLRKKKKRKEHSPYWIAQDAQHRYRCDVVRLDAWKQGTARETQLD